MYEDNGIYLWHMDSYWYVGNDLKPGRLRRGLRL